MAESDHISVQHVLISFQGAGTGATRSKQDAETLAYDVLIRARSGKDFDELVKEHTDDSPPGIYGMANRGVRPNRGEHARDKMVAAFGDTGFPLEVGEIGIADFDSRASPYGWHIVKRLT